MELNLTVEELIKNNYSGGWVKRTLVKAQSLGVNLEEVVTEKLYYFLAHFFKKLQTTIPSKWNNESERLENKPDNQQNYLQGIKTRKTEKSQEKDIFCSQENLPVSRLSEIQLRTEELQLVGVRTDIQIHRPEGLCSSSNNSQSESCNKSLKEQRNRETKNVVQENSDSLKKTGLASWARRVDRFGKECYERSVQGTSQLGGLVREQGQLVREQGQLVRRVAGIAETAVRAVEMFVGLPVRDTGETGAIFGLEPKGRRGEYPRKAFQPEYVTVDI